MLAVEQEILRVHGRAERAVANQVSFFIAEIFIVCRHLDNLLKQAILVIKQGMISFIQFSGSISISF